MSQVKNTLKGKAREAVKDLMLVSDNLEMVMDTLQNKFECPDYIIMNLHNKVIAMKKLMDCEINQISIFLNTINDFFVIIESLMEDR